MTDKTVKTAHVHSHEEHEHAHTDEHGNVYYHSHDHGSVDENGHRHSHSHSPEHKKAVMNRLSRAIGHLESVKRMVEDDRDCSEVLIQLMAVNSALKNTGKVILREHMSHCIVDSIKEGDYEAVEELDKAIEMFM